MVLSLLTAVVLVAQPPPSLDERLPLPPPPLLKPDKADRRDKVDVLEPQAPALVPGGDTRPTAPGVPSSPLTGVVPMGVLIAAMAGAVFWLKRREVQAPRYLQVVERVSFGPRRSVVVTKLGDELLIFGSAETGMSLLASRPVPATQTTHATSSAPSASGAASSFQEALDKETTEDEELRRKLQMGLRAKVAS